MSRLTIEQLWSRCYAACEIEGKDGRGGRNGRMKRISRAELRGKPLDEDCLKAKISKHEYGFRDKRQFCYGIVDCFDDEYLQKCKECKAFTGNAFHWQS